MTALRWFIRSARIVHGQIAGVYSHEVATLPSLRVRPSAGEPTLQPAEAGIAAVRSAGALLRSGGRRRTQGGMGVIVARVRASRMAWSVGQHTVQKRRRRLVVGTHHRSRAGHAMEMGQSTRAARFHHLCGRGEGEGQARSRLLLPHGWMEARRKDTERATHVPATPD